MPDFTPAASASVRHLGQILFSEYLLPFEVTSVLILVAIIGVVVLAKAAAIEQTMDLLHYLILSALLFIVGAVGFIIKKNMHLDLSLPGADAECREPEFCRVLEAFESGPRPDFRVSSSWWSLRQKQR